MSFFAVNFGDNNGYAHIIEKDEAFPLLFAEVIK
jgi:hypothetical protein